MLSDWSFIENLSHEYFDVIQKDFDFIALKTKVHPYGHDFSQLVANRLKLDFYPIEDFSLLFKEDRKINFKPTILAYKVNGTSYGCHQKLGKNILDFDYNVYNQNRLNFIKSNPNLTECVNFLFNHNIKLIAEYFQCSTDELMKPKFDIFKVFHKKLMIKITLKNQSK
jgi:hypothetical protein